VFAHLLLKEINASPNVEGDLTPTHSERDLGSHLLRKNVDFGLALEVVNFVDKLDQRLDFSCRLP
jgi:hypothetical protein